jgi:hypothetical protein
VITKAASEAGLSGNVEIAERYTCSDKVITSVTGTTPHSYRLTLQT